MRQVRKTLEYKARFTYLVLKGLTHLLIDFIRHRGWNTDNRD